MANTSAIEKEKKSTAFIVILRALACLLIINSHCREFYPIPFLAVGGGHGNAIFFILSGYLLANIKLPFFSWYKKRLARILPTTLIVLILGALIVDGKAGFTGVGVWSIFLRFVNRYWFVSTIILFYAIFYFLFRKRNKKFVLAAFGAYLIGYVLLYCFVLNKEVFSVELEGFSPFKVYFYFGVFLAGGVIRLWEDDEHLKKIKTPVLFALIALSALLWCGEYGLVMVFQTGLAMQGLIHLGVMLFATSLLLLFLRFSPRITMPGKALGKIITGLADSTLEIYLVQVTIPTLIPDLSFPLDFLIFVTVSIGGGLFVHYLTNFVKISRKG